MFRLNRISLHNIIEFLSESISQVEYILDPTLPERQLGCYLTLPIIFPLPCESTILLTLYLLPISTQLLISTQLHANCSSIAPLILVSFCYPDSITRRSVSLLLILPYYFALIGAMLVSSRVFYPHVACLFLKPAPIS